MTTDAAVNPQLLIAGAGIGGLAAACALAQKGHSVAVVEQASELQEVGAGIQLGPNAVRVIKSWDIKTAYREVACFPKKLEVRDGLFGQLLGQLLFGDDFVSRYRAPYSTVHRADLQNLLRAHALDRFGIEPQLNNRLTGYSAQADGVTASIAQTDASGVCHNTITAQALTGADGLWSEVRQHMLAGEAAPRYSGILAYRALVAQQDLPATLRSEHVTVWMAPQWHVVHYPVCAGKYLNVVALAEGPRPDDLQSWDHSTNAEDLRKALGKATPALRDLMEAISEWRLWPLCDRPPVSSAHHMAQGRIALLGDAAHPMRPFMAQGAGMALEDAWVLAECTSQYAEMPDALASFARKRWQRCAKVQQRSIRNGELFHSEGLMRSARNFAIRSLGERLLDVPWLYAQGPI